MMLRWVYLSTLVMLSAVNMASALKARMEARPEKAPFTAARTGAYNEAQSELRDQADEVYLCVRALTLDGELCLHVRLPKNEPA
jgi:hypothetical protein